MFWSNADKQHFDFVLCVGEPDHVAIPENILEYIEITSLPRKISNGSNSLN